ncbi:DUF2500 family protein [Faecalimicrobium sp. JNUCC 81]
MLDFIIDEVIYTASNSSSYYITFKFESKDRLEFEVSSKNYGMICENDYGKLKFQGTSFLNLIENSKKVA